jgi:muramoyltetrapeptide carboxypeptidase LdcA involved in peptidoglycan recycling
LETLSALMGTPYFPHIDEDCILFIEQDAEMGTPQRFDRRLEQLLQADFSSYFKGIMIGRFQKRNTVSIEQLKIIITSKKKLKNIPIVANIDFGHTTPMATFPI